MVLKAKNRAVGLEMDSESVRIVQVEGSPRAPRLRMAESAALAAGDITDGMVQRPDAVGQALKGLFRARGFATDNIILGLTNQGVLVREVSVPRVPRDKLKQVVAMQAEEYLPVPLESVVLDSLVIGESTREGNSALEVLLVAARRDMLQAFLEAFARAGLQLRDIDVSALALARVLPEKIHQRTVAVVNVANGPGNLLVVSQGQPRMARLVAVKLGELAEALGCSVDAVPGVVAGGGAAERGPYEKWVSALENEIRSTLNYYLDRGDGPPLEAIILNGRGARLREIAPLLERTLSLPVRIANPLQEFASAGSTEVGPGRQVLDYAVCAGLARRGLEGS